MSNNIVATPPPRSRAASWFIVVPPSREIGPPTDQPGHARHCYHLLSSSLRRAPTHTHTHTHTYTHIPLVAKPGQFLPISVLFETNAFEVVWNCLKSFEDVWRRLNERFSISLKRYMIFFFFLRERLYDERDLLPRVERKEGTDVNENDVNIRSGWEEKRVFCLYSLEKKWRLLIVLFWFETNTRHCLNYKEMNKIRMQRNDRWSNLSDLVLGSRETCPV